MLDIHSVAHSAGSTVVGMGVRLSPDRVKAQRRALKLTQEDLAERSGLSQESVSRIEGGVMQGRAAGTQEALALALQTSVAYLRAETDDPSPSRAVHLAGSSHGRAAASGALTVTPAADLPPLERAVVAAFAPLAATTEAEVLDESRAVAREIHTMPREGSDLSAVASDVINAVRALRREGKARTSTAVLMQIAAPRWVGASPAAIEEPAPAPMKRSRR